MTHGLQKKYSPVNASMAAKRRHDTPPLRKTRVRGLRLSPDMNADGEALRR
jgi:hypothetical protein